MKEEREHVKISDCVNLIIAAIIVVAIFVFGFCLALFYLKWSILGSFVAGYLCIFIVSIIFMYIEYHNKE